MGWVRFLIDAFNSNRWGMFLSSSMASGSSLMPNAFNDSSFVNSYMMLESLSSMASITALSKFVF